MPAKSLILIALILFPGAVAHGDEPQPTSRSADSKRATPFRASSTQDLVRRAAEQLEAATNLEENSKGSAPEGTSRTRTADETKELCVRIAEVQKQLDRLRELTGGPVQFEFQFRVLEIPAKLAAELSAIGTEPLTGPPARSLYNNTAELTKRIREAGGVKTLCETSIVAPAGRRVTFHSGGEFPILVPAKGDEMTVQWRKFGNCCELVGFHLDSNRLRVEFEAESSQRNHDEGVVTAGFTVPGLTIRRVSTQVDMSLGETIVVALPATDPGKPKSKADPANGSGEPPVTLFMLTPTPMEKR